MSKIRRVKYRVWDKKTKRMLYDIDSGSLIGRILPTLVFKNKSIEQTVNENRRRFLFLLSSNMFDKDGQEMYEGDIWQALDPFNPKRRVGVKKVIKWETSPRYTGLNIGLSAKVSRVVLGNIYENPDLIKGKKA